MHPKNAHYLPEVKAIFLNNNCSGREPQWALETILMGPMMGWCLGAGHIREHF